MSHDLKQLFESWGREAKDQYVDQQWLLSKWEVVEGIVWPSAKIEVMINTITEGLGLKKSDQCVDLGCGGGWILKQLRPKVRKIIGLDFSQSMLAKAKTFCPRETFVAGEIGRLPFQADSFDCALSYFVFLNFMEDRFVDEALADVIRILKPGGRALIGQLPDQTKSHMYDREKQAYLEYCKQHYQLGESHRDVCRAPQKLFDKARLEKFLRQQQVSYDFVPSFNPFYRPGAERVIDWRFDLVLKKSLTAESGS